MQGTISLLSVALAVGLAPGLDMQGRANMEDILCKAALVEPGPRPAARQEPESKPITDNPGLKLLTGEGTPLKKDAVICFFGDSITWQGGYIQLMERALASSTFTESLNIKLLKRGINGGKSTDLRDGCENLYGCTQAPFAELMASDKPDLAVIYIGINDVWHGAKGTSPGDFEACLRGLVAKARAHGVTPLLATPTTIGEKPDGTNGFDEKLDQYATIARKVAKETDTILVDLRRAFLDYLKRNNKRVEQEEGKTDFKRQGILTYDGVHMLPEGNALLANELGKGIVKALRGDQGKR